MNEHRSRRGWVALVAAVGLVVSGCGPSSADKAGGAAPVPKVLTMANEDSDNAVVESFLQAVNKLSSGTLQINPTHNWRTGDMQGDGDLVKDVEAGKADLGVVPDRAFDTVGVNSFEALQAPFLIDTYALEGKVLSSSIPAQMLDGLGAAGLVGLTILPGPFRRVLGRSRTFTSVADFRGATIGIRPSGVLEMTLTALGATPVPFVADGAAPFSTYDGIDSHLAAIEGNNYDAGAKALTANVDFYPRSSAIFVNAKSFAGLTAEQQGWLRAAGGQAVAGEMPNVLSQEAVEGGVLCNRNLLLVSASADDLAALRQAVEPVYAALSANPQTKAFIDQIDAMRSANAAPPEAAPACAVAESSPVANPSSAPVTPIDGTWAVNFTHAEFLAAVPPPDPTEDIPGNWGPSTMDLHAGKITISYSDGTAPLGTFTVVGNRMMAEFPNGDEFDVTWSLYRDTLAFGDGPGVVPTGWRVKPWRRVGP